MATLDTGTLLCGAQFVEVAHLGESFRLKVNGKAWPGGSVIPRAGNRVDLWEVVPSDPPTSKSCLRISQANGRGSLPPLEVPPLTCALTVTDRLEYPTGGTAHIVHLLEPGAWVGQQIRRNGQVVLERRFCPREPLLVHRLEDLEAGAWTVHLLEPDGSRALSSARFRVQDQAPPPLMAGLEAWSLSQDTLSFSLDTRRRVAVELLENGRVLAETRGPSGTFPLAGEGPYSLRLRWGEASTRIPLPGSDRAGRSPLRLGEGLEATAAPRPGSRPHRGLHLEGSLEPAQTPPRMEVRWEAPPAAVVATLLPGDPPRESFRVEFAPSQGLVLDLPRRPRAGIEVRLGLSSPRPGRALLMVTDAGCEGTDLEQAFGRCLLDWLRSATRSCRIGELQPWGVKARGNLISVGPSRDKRPEDLARPDPWEPPPPPELAPAGWSCRIQVCHTFPLEGAHQHPLVLPRGRYSVRAYLFSAGDLLTARARLEVR